MFFNRKKKGENSSKINWIPLTDEGQLTEIVNKSEIKPQLVFKHSTRCSISSVAKTRLEREWGLSEDQCDVYYLDLLTYRPVSNKIVDLFSVEHQSPQAILIKNGAVVYHGSHNMIDTTRIENEIEKS